MNTETDEYVLITVICDEFSLATLSFLICRHLSLSYINIRAIIFCNNANSANQFL